MGWIAVALAAGCGTAQADPTQPCRVPGISHGVQCGVVVRPLDPARPQGATIEVHFMVVPALARRKLADPVFLLAGGPGQSAITVAPQTLPLFARLNTRRDIVFVDQRGTGRSMPLECDEPARETLAEQADPQRQVTLLLGCKAALERRPALSQPGALGFFTTTIAMQDLDAVRRALGAERINLVGVSYGTRAALEYMRQFPGAVRRAVLDAVAPPDMVLPTSFSTDNQAALDALLNACESEPACARAYPRLRADWHALLGSLPRAVTAAHPLTGTPERFTLTREMVLGAVRGTLYAPNVAAALPAAITEAAAGRFEALAGMGSLLGARKGLRLAAGMHFSVVCAEDAPRMDSAVDRPGADFADDFAQLYRRVCAAWPRGAVPGDFYTIAARTSPTLLFSGSIDPVTPPRHGERVARALGPAAQHVVVPNAGHGALAIGCARDLVFRFIDAVDDADAKVDARCLQSVPRPGAFMPARLSDGASR
jgi:pimeloyl-ACP methyl ester carboxylesterase